MSRIYKIDDKFVEFPIKALDQFREWYRHDKDFDKSLVQALVIRCAGSENILNMNISRNIREFIFTWLNCKAKGDVNRVSKLDSYIADLGPILLKKKMERINKD